MIRPLIYRTFTRFVVGLTLILLWNRFINTSSLLTVTGHGFFFMGAVFLAWSWFSFLRLDGVKITQMKPREDNPWRKRRAAKAMADFVDTEVAFDGMDDRDLHIAGFFANILTGLCFIIPSVIVSLLR